jgi:hypothetical protein
VTPRDGQSVLPQGLAFRALEIEELADVHFFRPLGSVVVLVYFHRIDLFFAFILFPMNLAFLALWLWQRSADCRFLAGL